MCSIGLLSSLAVLAVHQQFALFCGTEMNGIECTLVYGFKKMMHTKKKLCDQSVTE